MFTVTLTTPVIILIILALVLGIWIFSCNNAETFLGSDRSWAIIISAIVMIIAFLIVGGIWWW
jgi:hypothetical protein